MDTRFQVAYITSVEEYTDNTKENSFKNKYNLKVSGYTVANGEVRSIEFEKGYEGDTFYYKTPFKDMKGGRNNYDSVFIQSKRMFSNMNEHFAHIIFAPRAYLHIVDKDFSADYTIGCGENVAKAMSELYSSETYKDKKIFQQAVVESSPNFQKECPELANDIDAIKSYLSKRRDVLSLDFTKDNELNMDDEFLNEK